MCRCFECRLCVVHCCHALFVAFLCYNDARYSCFAIIQKCSLDLFNDCALGCSAIGEKDGQALGALGSRMRLQVQQRAVRNVQE